MIKDQRRLICADERNPDTITHHCAPRSGTVHVGHPRLCSEMGCRQWGSELMGRSETEQPETRHPVYSWIGIFLTVLMIAIAAGIIIVTIRNL